MYSNGEIGLSEYDEENCLDLTMDDGIEENVDEADFYCDAVAGKENEKTSAVGTLKISKRTAKAKRMKKPTVPKAKAKAKARVFSVEEKKALAQLVENHPHLWNLNHKWHSNIYAVSNAWQKIAMAFPECKESDCKAVWRSLKNSSTYFRNKKSLKGNTGDSADEDASPQSDDFGQWEFAQCMSFLQPMSQKYPRKTTVLGICDENNRSSATIPTRMIECKSNELNATVEMIDGSATERNDVLELSESLVATDIGSYVEVITTERSDVGNSESNSIHMDNNDDVCMHSNASLYDQLETSDSASFPDQSESSDSASFPEHLDATNCASNYAYANQSKKKDLLTDSVVSITKTMEELVSCRKTEMQRMERGTQPQNLKFGYMWGNFDQLLQMLPTSDVLDLNVEFLNLIHAKLKSAKV